MGLQDHMNEPNMNAFPNNDTPTQMPSQTNLQNETTVEYASFTRRLAAMIVDAVIVSAASFFIISLVGGVTGEPNGMLSNGLQFLFSVVYAVILIAKQGATLGKQALGIKVVKQDTGNLLTPGEAFMREVIGKFLSGIALLLGYFWMLFDKNSQTWHDKLAGSIVIKTK